jgi:hypothetical protein
MLADHLDQKAENWPGVTVKNQPKGLMVTRPGALY